MTKIPIATLDHADPSVAAEIHAVMLAAYRVEADLLGVSDFPPLRRRKEEIAASDNSFIGASLNAATVAVAEIERDEDGTIRIAACVVLPSHFRRGFGRALVQNIIDRYAGQRIAVCTGARNAPALSLYRQFGFDLSTSWTEDDFMQMMEFVREP